MGCPRRSPARRRLLVSAVQTVALLLGCLVVAVGLTHATIAACPELAAALGGTAARGPAPTQGFMPPPNSPELEKMQFLMRRGALFKVGAEAPDFTLPDASGRPVRLGSFRGKRPVVLVFGSFGWNLFCGQLGRLVKLRDAYAGRVEFLFVYVSEALHDSTPLPDAACPMPPEGEGAEGHLRRVRWYEGESGKGLTWLLDGGDGAVEEAYSAWPRRLVVVGVDGRVAYDAGIGLFGNWDMDEVGRQLEAVLDGGYLH